MAMSAVPDTASGRADVTVRLRIEVYDALAKSKGAESVTAQARMHGLDRSHMHALKNGESLPKVDTALRMAADLGTTVEALFERVRVAV